MLIVYQCSGDSTGGFYVPWGEYPEIEGGTSTSVPLCALALLESIEPDLTDSRDVVVVDQGKDEELALFLGRLLESVGAITDKMEAAAAAGMSRDPPDCPHTVPVTVFEHGHRLFPRV